MVAIQLHRCMRLRRGMVHSHSRDSEHLPRLQDPVLEHAEKGTTQKEKNNNAMKSFRTATITTILTSDLIFPKWQHEPFKTILDEQNLRFDRDGRPRTAYSLRHTYICLRLRRDKKALQSTLVRQTDDRGEVPYLRAKVRRILREGHRDGRGPLHGWWSGQRHGTGTNDSAITPQVFYANALTVLNTPMLPS
jgi:hypothetical protein